VPQDPQAIREQLQRILISPVFLHSDRLRRFLTHCVDAALEGRADDLKEYIIGVAAFDRPVHYNPAEDPIVRVEARRLRRKLDEYYQSYGAADAIVIHLPKGGYLPAFELRKSPPAPPRRNFPRAGLAALAAGCLALIWVAWQRWHTALPELALSRATSDHALTTDPALSADGRLLVYASDRQASGGLDIWLQPLGQNSAPSRLTGDPADDAQPAISPDGSQVAFRSERQPPGVYLVRASGGPATLLAPDGRNPRYSPDGKWLAYWIGAPGGDGLPPAGKVYVMPSGGGAPRRILAGFASTSCPVWSPDSDRLLLEARQDAGDPLELWSVPLQDEHAAATGIARLLDQARLKFALRECSLSWGRRAVVFSAAQGDTQNLWRVPASSTGEPIGALVRSTLGSAEEALPFEAPSGAIAFAGRSATQDVWRFPVDRPEELERVTDGAASPAFPNARGNRLTWISRGEGHAVVWLKNLETGETRQVTSATVDARYPQLCPDGSVMFSDGTNTFAAVPGRQARLVCNGCSRVWQCTGRSLLFVPAGGKSPVEIDEFPLPAGPKAPLVVAGHDLANPQLSSDGWLVFHAITGVTQRQVFVAPYRAGSPVPRDAWIPITDGSQLDRSAVWNERSDTLYFLSERCGFRCIWSQRVDARTRQPIGAAVAVRHFHSARRGLSAIGDVGAIGLSCTGGFLYFTVAEQSGDVWLARPGR
jgi:Tol biopolymer transport system component